MARRRVVVGGFDADFLAGFARDGVFERLTGLDETRERRAVAGEPGGDGLERDPVGSPDRGHRRGLEAVAGAASDQGDGRTDGGEVRRFHLIDLPLPRRLQGRSRAPEGLGLVRRPGPGDLVRAVPGDHDSRALLRHPSAYLKTEEGDGHGSGRVLSRMSCFQVGPGSSPTTAVPKASRLARP